MALFGILGILWLSAIGLTIAQRIKPNFARSWIIAITGASLALIGALVLRLYLPIEINLIHWQPESLYHTTIAFRIDYLNWSYMVANLALCIAVILTDSSRASATTTPQTSAGALVVTGLSLLSIMSKGPLTMSIAWAVIDFSVLIYLLILTHDPTGTAKLTTFYGVRLVSNFVLIAATAIGWQVTAGLGFDQIPPTASLFFLIAAGLRLGVLMLNPPMLESAELKRGTGLLLRFTPVASALVLIAYLPSEILILKQSLVSIISILTVLAALFASAMWFTRKDTYEGRPYWIMALSAFALQTALNGQPAQSRAWGLALLLSGGVLFLFDPPIRRIRFIPLLGLIGLLGLPYTLAASGWSALLSKGLSVTGAAMILSHAMLLGGYLRYIIEANSTVTGLEKFARITYPLGLILLIQIILILNLVGWVDVLTVGTWWGSAVSLGLVLLGYGLMKKLGIRLTDPNFLSRLPFARVWLGVLKALRETLSLNWVYAVARWVFIRLSDAARFFRLTLEGEAGVLWSLFFILVMAIIFYTQVGLP